MCLLLWLRRLKNDSASRREPFPFISLRSRNIYIRIEFKVHSMSPLTLNLLQSDAIEMNHRFSLLQAHDTIQPPKHDNGDIIYYFIPQMFFNKALESIHFLNTGFKMCTYIVAMSVKSNFYDL